MKILDIPQSGRQGTFISFKTQHGQSRRLYVPPRDARTPLQLSTRARWAEAVARWQGLTEPQRMKWRAAGCEVRSRGRLGDTGVLNGFQLFMKINANLAHLGQPWADDPPSRPEFSRNPVGQFYINNNAGDIGLKLAVSAAPVECILVSATAPASPGNSFPRRFIFLGLLPAPQAGASDITQMYLAIHRQLPVDTRVFVRTVQQLDGWQTLPHQTSAVVPAASFLSPEAAFDPGL